MNSKRRSIFLIICCLALTVSVSYAWILSQDPLSTKRLSADYGKDSGNKLRIAASSAVSMEVLYLDKTSGEYVNCDAEHLGTLALFQNLVPNDTVNFKLRISNTSDITQKAALSVGGIKNTSTGVSLEDSLIPKMYLNVSPGKGYVSSSGATTVTVPDSLFLKLSEGTDTAGTGELTLNLYSNLMIPPTGSDPTTGYVELDCYFWLDHNAGNEYQDLTMSVEYFRLVI